MSNIFASLTSARLALLLVAGVGLSSACGTSTDNTSASTPMTQESSTTISDVTSPNDVIDPWSTPGQNMRGLRYCEFLFLNATETGLAAEVYNTYPLNDCPLDQWESLDSAAIAQEQGVPLAIANGPRYWLMDAVRKSDQDSIVTKVFGGMAMNRYAQVLIGKPDSVGVPYTPQSVDRSSVFVFAAGQTIFVLVNPDGLEFVMQSWSQQRDPALTEADLATLGDRLQLLEGWRYESRVLDKDLVVDTSDAPAQVLQDELMNSYSLIP